MKAANRVLAGVQNPTHEQDQAIAQLQYSEVNFNKLVYEVLKLRRQRTKDLEELSQQKEKIIALYGRLQHSQSSSPLWVA